jgi:two-component system, LytTR family, response regulator
MQDQLLKLSVMDGELIINPFDIIRLRACNSYTFIYFTNRKPMVICKVLKEFEAALGGCGFIRTHRTHLINRQYINHITDDEKIVMVDNFIAHISRRMKPAVMKKLNHAA